MVHPIRQTTTPAPASGGGSPSPPACSSAAATANAPGSLMLFQLVSTQPSERWTCAAGRPVHAFDGSLSPSSLCPASSALSIAASRAWPLKGFRKKPYATLAADPALQARFDILVSIPGVGQATALAVLVDQRGASSGVIGKPAGLASRVEMHVEGAFGDVHRPQPLTRLTQPMRSTAIIRWRAFDSRGPRSRITLRRTLSARTQGRRRRNRGERYRCCRSSM